jgi:hypothetical protein
MSLLIEPFKKILHCHWLIFSRDSQREVFVNTALVYSHCLPVFIISNVYLRNFTIFTSDFYQRYLETFSTMFMQFAIAANDLESLHSLQRLYTELEKNIDASRTNFVDKLLSGAINSTSRSLARNFGAESYC